MNCKQGDLAVVVRSRHSNAGRVMTCLCIATTEELVATFGSTMTIHDPIWRVDVPLLWINAFRERIEVLYAADEALRPLRDSEGEDEMLRIAGLPQPEFV